MKRILFLACILLFGFSAFGSDLEISAVPASPILIVSSTYPSGQFDPIAPYFDITSIKGVWKGQAPLTLAGIILQSNDSENVVSCFAGEGDMGRIFPNYPLKNGSVEIQPGESFATSGFFCDNLMIKDLTQQNYNIPVTVRVFGLSNADKEPQYVEGDAEIVVQ